MIDWQKEFSQAHLTSWPTPGLSIQNTRPPHATARNIFQEDKAAILKAADEFGYRVVSPPGCSAKVVSFVKP